MSDFDDKKDTGLQPNQRWGGANLNSEVPQKFPFEAFETDDPNQAVPYIKVKSPWGFNLEDAPTTYYAPEVANPSAGTYHPLTTDPTGATILNQVATGGTWYSVDFSAVIPSGTKAVFATILAVNGNAVRIMIRPFGSSWSSGQQISGMSINETGVQRFGTQTIIPIDSDGKAELSVATSDTLNVYRPVGYWT